MWDAATRAHRAAPAQPEAAAQVHELAPDELAALVGGIVQVTLDTQLPECLGARRAALATELELRLRRLLGLGPAEVHERVAPAAEPATPSEGAPAPGAEFAHSSSTLAPQLSPAARALELVLEERLARLGGPLAERSDLRQRLIAIGRSALEVTPGAEGASLAELQDLDLLERRARKLERALQEARAALAYVSGLAHVDEGLASIYRAVQGLAHDDPRRVQKREALERIFQANLELRRQAGGPGASA